MISLCKCQLVKKCCSVLQCLETFLKRTQRRFSEFQICLCASNLNIQRFCSIWAWISKEINRDWNGAITSVHAKILDNRECICCVALSLLERLALSLWSSKACWRIHYFYLRKAIPKSTEVTKVPGSHSR